MLVKELCEILSTINPINVFAIDCGHLTLQETIFSYSLIERYPENEIISLFPGDELHNLRTLNLYIRKES